MTIVEFLAVIAAPPLAAMALGASTGPGSWLRWSLIASTAVGARVVLCVDLAFSAPHVPSAHVIRGLILCGGFMAALPFFGYCALGKLAVHPVIGWPTHRLAAILAIWLISLIMFVPYSSLVGFSVATFVRCPKSEPDCLAF